MKARRNEPCPCGSGKKFKHCHGKSQWMARIPAIVLASFLVAGAAFIVMAYFFPNGDEGAPDTPRNVSQPPGPPPPGKIWSPEHGHWHNLRNLGDLNQPGQVPDTAKGPPFAQPPGPVPEGKVWSTEHGRWHNIVSDTTPKGPFPQPPGPVPEGKMWSPEHGHWHNKLDAIKGPIQMVPQRLPSEQKPPEKKQRPPL